MAVRQTKENQVTFFPGDEVSEADRGEGDDYKVDGLERAPALDVLEDDGWQGHEDETPEEDEEQGGDDADLRLAYFPLLWGEKKTTTVLVERTEELFHPSVLTCQHEHQIFLSK